MGLKELLDSTVSGAAYGLTAVLVSHPWDTIKTKQQTEPRFQHQPLLRVLRSVRPAELYRGFGAAAAGSVAFRALPFIAYGYSSAELHRYAPTYCDRHPVLMAGVAGSTGGLARSLVECPLEVAKVRRQVGVAWRWRAMYRGLAVTAVRNGSVIGLFWSFVVASEGLRDRVTTSTTLRSFLAGGGCSTAAWLVVYPIDVLKSRVQRGGPGEGSALSALRSVSGIRGLYAGLTAGLLRSVFANGVAFVVYDKVKRRLVVAEQ